MTRKAHLSKIVEAYRAISEWIVRGLGQPPQWPLDLMEWIYYMSQFFPRECYNLIMNLESEIGDVEIAKLFRYPSSIGHWLYFPEAHFGVKEEYWARDLSMEEGIKFIEKAVDFLYILRKGDAFCRDFRNILLDQGQVREVVRNNAFLDLGYTPNMRSILPALNVTLWHYCMLIQGGLRIHSMELHGPYEVNDDEALFVREYSSLKPQEIWNFTSKFPFEKICIYEVYKDMQIQIDVLGHYWMSARPPQKLVRIAAVADGKSLDLQDIEELKDVSFKVLTSGNSTVRDFSREDWIRKWIELGYFWLKPLRDILNEDWRPPTKVLELAYDKKEAEKARKGSQQHIQLVGQAITNLPKEKAIEEIARMHLKTIYWEW